MWVDEHGSEVLDLAECRLLVARAAGEGAHGHLGLSTDGAPVVLPLDFAVSGRDLVVRIGPRLRARTIDRLVAFEVDGCMTFEGDQAASPWYWSVLVRGLARALGPGEHPVPPSRASAPGAADVHIRCDRMTGRRFASSPSPSVLVPPRR